mgnify:FL=1
MNVHRFPPDRDPGASFMHLLQATGIDPFPVAAGELEVPHGTTCVALKYGDGVVIAGDRRATAGSLIRRGNMEKVVQADDYCGVAISGAAGPAVEMIKLFQLQLEHYEKMEGHPLSLEGKANQLSLMVRNNMPAAMQGFGVFPLFAGFEPRDGTGHIWDFDGTGGRYAEREYVAIGSGMVHAGTVIKVGWRSNIDRQGAVTLACRSLWEAAESDSATGGPDLLRGIFPIVATIDADGWRAVSDSDLEAVFLSIQDEVRSR